MTVIHVVEPGESLFTIAQRYGVTVESIVAVNRPPDPSRLVVGQTLVIVLPEEPVRDVVRRGDTLFRIAQIYGTTVARLVEVNRIPDPNLILPGQVLIIPDYRAERYTVRPGDTLFLISQRFGTTVTILARVNNIADPNRIFVGQVLIIPRRVPLKRIVTTNGFYFPVSTTTAQRVMGQLGPFLTYVSIFDWRVDGTGGVVAPPNFRPLADAARANAVRPLMVLTNFGAVTFDPDLAHRTMADPAVRAQTITTAVNIARTERFPGVMVDFENMLPADRPLFNDFVRELREAARAAGLTFMVAMAPKAADRPTEPWVGTFDYATIGALADMVVIMTYEWGWVGGPPMAISPLNQVRAVLTYAVSLIPREKILQGVNLYGYNWELPDTPENLAVTTSPQDALRLALRYNVAISYDPVAQAPWFRYTAENGIVHEVWFEDARSIKAKYDLNTELALGGFSYWNLAYDFPQNWALLGDLFTVQKLPLT